MKILISTLVITAAVASSVLGQQEHTRAMSSVAQTREFFRYRGHNKPIVSAHRGGNVAGYPENSIPAFENALRAAPMIFETDPHLTADNQIVIMHDPTLDRTTLERGRVKDRSLAEVQAIGMKDFQGTPVPSVHPPSLEQLILWAKDKTILNLSLGWWNVPRCLRDSHSPSATIHLRTVSRPTRIPFRSNNASVASVGLKSR